MKIISASEMAKLDRAAKASSEELMERAGAGMAYFIRENFPKFPVCIICGTGNNGGDGMVTARYLAAEGREVDVVLTGEKSGLKDLPRFQARKLNMRINEVSRINLESMLERKKIVVDCILGTGFNPPLKKDIKNILEIINKKSKITLSCDIPTGVNGNTGEADENSVIADATVTFEYPKIGHVVSPGCEFAGSVEVVKIGIDLSPSEYLENIEFTAESDCLGYFVRRKRAAHKKSFGHVMVIGGSPGMEGAVSMTALGALRAGAGLVTCAVSRNIAKAVAGHTMSAINLELDNSGYLTEKNFHQIKQHIDARHIDSIVVGPGLTAGEGQQKLVENLLRKTDMPVVLDADGLNCVSNNPEVLKRKGETVITPHPGEMSRLSGRPVSEILQNREETVKEISNKYDCVVVLKGFRSLIASGDKVFVNSTGNPGMATGGSGDVLSGIIAALVGEGFNPLDAARTGVWVHGRAGDLARFKNGERYILPEDILRELGNI